MKKQITDFIRSLGGKAAYSGKTKTMHITAPFSANNQKQEIAEKVKSKFGPDLPFNLHTN